MPTTAPTFYDQSVKPTRRRPAWEQDRGPLNNILGRTREGRLIVRNPDGSVSTEVTETFEHNGNFVNIPTMFGGRRYPPDEAFNLVKRYQWHDPDTWRALPFYKTKEEAIRAAQERSQQLGQELQPLLGATQTPSGTIPSWRQETYTPKEVYYSIPPQDEALEEPVVAPETYGLGRLPYLVGALSPAFWGKAEPLFKTLYEAYRKLFRFPGASSPLSNETYETVSKLGEAGQGWLQKHGAQEISGMSNFTAPMRASFDPYYYAAYFPPEATPVEHFKLNPLVYAQPMSTIPFTEFSHAERGPLATQLFQGLLGNTYLHELGHLRHRWSAPEVFRNPPAWHGPLWASLTADLRNQLSQRAGTKAGSYFPSPIRIPTRLHTPVDLIEPIDVELGKAMTAPITDDDILRMLEDYAFRAQQFNRLNP